VRKPENLKKAILTYLQANNGSSTLGDESKPDDIYATFHVSKKVYKRALSSLYKDRVIKIEKDRILLV